MRRRRLARRLRARDRMSCAAGTRATGGCVRVARRRRHRGAAAAAVLARRHALELLADRPFGLFRGDLDAFDQRGVLGLAPVRLHVAVAIGVEDAELHRVHADEMRELVHLAFDRKVHRGDAEAAHGGRRRAVGEHAIDIAIDVGDRVGARQMRRAFDGGIAREPGIGAAVEISADLARDDAAVAHHAVLDVDALGAARRTVLHLLLAPERIAYRASGQHGAEDAERLGQRIHLAAKAAAHRAADEVEGVGRHIEDFGAGIEREEQRLRRGIDDVASIGVGRRDRAVGFGRRMLDRRHLVALLEHMVGPGEAAIGVAEAQLLVIVDVVIDERVLRIGLVDHGRAGLQGVLDVEHRRQRLVVDPHFRHRLIGVARTVRDDGDDRLALVAHLVDRERRLVVLAEIDQAEQGVEVARHVGAADDPAHARPNVPPRWCRCGAGAHGNACCGPPSDAACPAACGRRNRSRCP